MTALCLAAALSLLLHPLSQSVRAQEETFPVPGRELWGTWRVDAIRVPKLPNDVPIQSLTGWKELLDEDPGVLPVNQLIEFNDPGDDEPVRMTLLKPIQPGVCLNDAWMSHCAPGTDDSYRAPKRPIVRTMLVEPSFVSRYNELSAYWPDLAPDRYDLIFEDIAPRRIFVNMALRDPNVLYFPFVVFDKVLANSKGMDGMVILKRISKAPTKTAGK